MRGRSWHFKRLFHAECGARFRIQLPAAHSSELSEVNSVQEQTSVSEEKREDELMIIRSGGS